MGIRITAIHTDFRLRNEVKPFVLQADQESSLRRLAEHMQRIAREEPLHAKDDRRKIKEDATGRQRCVRCGLLFGYAVNKDVCNRCERAK